MFVAFKIACISDIYIFYCTNMAWYMCMEATNKIFIFPALRLIILKFFFMFTVYTWSVRIQDEIFELKVNGNEKLGGSGRGQ